MRDGSDSSSDEESLPQNGNQIKYVPLFQFVPAYYSEHDDSILSCVANPGAVRSTSTLLTFMLDEDKPALATSQRSSNKLVLATSERSSINNL